MSASYLDHSLMHLHILGLNSRLHSCFHIRIHKCLMLDYIEVKNEDDENQEYNGNLQDCLRNLNFLDKVNMQGCFLFQEILHLKESKLLNLKHLVSHHLLENRLEIEHHGNFRHSMMMLDKLVFWGLHIDCLQLEFEHLRNDLVLLNKDLDLQLHHHNCMKR